MNKKRISFLTLLLMLILMIPVTSTAAEIDYQEHWAGDTITKWVEKGIITGSNEGMFRPNDYLTRGEMAVIINKIMNYQTTSVESFHDLDENFYTDAILKAHQAGVLNGANGFVRPNDNITREEIAVLLCNVFHLEPQESSTLNFSDSDQIASWAVGYVSSLFSEKYIAGRDNNRFDPKGNVTRAEAITILDNIIKEIYNFPGVYTERPNGTVLVNTPGVTLKNMTIAGDLIVAEGVGNGDLTLDSIELNGDLIVKGGGANSVKITGSSNIKTAKIIKSDGNVRIAVSGRAKVAEAIVYPSCKNVTFTGNIHTIEINSTNNTINADAANITNVNINTGAHFVVENNSTVNALTMGRQASNSNIEIKGNVGDIHLNSAQTIINIIDPAVVKNINIVETASNTVLNVGENSTVNEIITNAENTIIQGEGNVNTIEIKADNAKINTTDTVLKIDDNISGTIANGHPLEGGSTSTTTQDGITDSNNSSNSSSGGSDPYINYAYINTAVPVVGTSVYAYTEWTSPEVVYQWQKAIGPNYNNWTDITTSDGTSKHYTPKNTDVGSKLRVIITGTRGYTGTQTSNPTEIVIDPDNIQTNNSFELALKSSAANIKVTSNISLPADAVIPSGKNIIFHNGLTLNGNLTIGATADAANRTTFSIYGTLQNNYVMTIGSNADFIIMPNSALQNNTGGSILILDGGAISGTNTTSQVENQANYPIGSTTNSNYQFAPDSVYSWNQTTNLWSVILKTVTVGTQKGTLNAGTAGTVTFEVTTENIEDGITPTINWANGTFPAGIAANVTSIKSNKATITLTGDTNTAAGSTNFTVTADGITSSNATLVIEAPIPVTKNVTVGTQKGTLNAGTAGTVTFEVTTENIEDGITPAINWANGTFPAGITPSISTIRSNKATITLTGDTNTAAGSTNFTVTADEVTSSNATLVIEAPIPVIKNVTVGTQKGTLNAGTAGTVTFEVTTENISDGVTPTINWANGTAPNGISASVTPITSNKIIIFVNGNTNTAAGSTNFTVTADGVTSSNATLVVSAPIPVTKTVTVGTQKGTLNAGTAGTVTFEITTENISDGIKPTINWANGTRPNGIRDNVSTITGNKATITFTGDTNTAAGNTNFTVTADGVTSSNATLVVSAPIPVTKTVTVGTQQGILNAGTAGTVTFEVTTENISDGVTPTINWANGTAPNGISASVTPITSNKIIIFVNGNTNTAAGSTNFTVTADGVTSSNATLVIGP